MIITFAAIQTNQVTSGAIQTQQKMLLIIANLQKKVKLCIKNKNPNRNMYVLFQEAKEETKPGRKLNFDRSCDKNVTVLVENGLTLSGKYVLSTLWKGGRGVYVRIDYR